MSPQNWSQPRPEHNRKKIKHSVLNPPPHPNEKEDQPQEATQFSCRDEMTKTLANRGRRQSCSWDVKGLCWDLPRDTGKTGSQHQLTQLLFSCQTTNTNRQLGLWLAWIQIEDKTQREHTCTKETCLRSTGKREGVKVGPLYAFETSLELDWINSLTYNCLFWEIHGGPAPFSLCLMNYLRRGIFETSSTVKRWSRGECTGSPLCEQYLKNINTMSSYRFTICLVL